MMQWLRIAACALGCSAVTLVTAATTSELEVLRLQQERAQQQMELQLRMQQQQERAMRPPSSPAGEVQLRRFEVEQQQRLQQFQDEQSRATAAAAAEQRARKAAVQVERAGEVRRLESQGRVNTDRSIAGSSP